METLRIGPIKVNHEGNRVEAELQLGAVKHLVYYKTDDARLTPNLEAFITMALVPCMKKRVSITAEGQVSPGFLAKIENAQKVLHSWKPGYKQVEIKGVHPVEDDIPRGGRAGLFFSAGMDSFYTLIKNQDEISDLVFVHGFDVPLEEHSMRSRMSEAVRRVGEHFNKRVIEVETNVREFHDAYVFWGYSHGAILGSIGHLLGPSFGRFYFSAARTYGRVRPYGVHPDLDPNWGSENLEYIHAGLEAWRYEKAALIAEHDVALGSLRVCLFIPESNLNCGQCEKCLTSMVFLRTAGALDRCTTFEVPLDLEQFTRLKTTADPSDTNIGKCLEILAREGRDPELAQALRKVLYRPVWQKWSIKAVRNLRKKLPARLRR